MCPKNNKLSKFDEKDKKILKMERSGILKTQKGLNIRNSGLKVMLVFINTKNVNEFMKKANPCPYMINIFRISGPYNVIVMIAATKMKTITKVLDTCLKNDDNINEIKMSLMVESVQDFIIPMDFSIENFNEASCYANGCELSKETNYQFVDNKIEE